jgi:hypothetical protein
VQEEAEEDEEEEAKEEDDAEPTQGGLLCYDAKDWHGDLAPVFRRCVHTLSVRGVENVGGNLRGREPPGRGLRRMISQPS